MEQILSDLEELTDVSRKHRSEQAYLKELAIIYNYPILMLHQTKLDHVLQALSLDLIEHIKWSLPR